MSYTKNLAGDSLIKCPARKFNLKKGNDTPFV